MNPDLIHIQAYNRIQHKHLNLGILVVVASSKYTLDLSKQTIYCSVH